MSYEPYPLIITIDGLDASGKETLAHSLVFKLREMGIRSRWISFPYYESKTGKLIKNVLSNETFLKTVPAERRPYLISELFVANRKEFFDNTNIDFKYDQCVYIFDRYSASNILYQGLGMTDGELNQLIKYNNTLDYEVYGNYKPAFSFFLRVPYTVLRKRLATRISKSGVDDNYEKENFLKSVYHLSEYIISNQDKVAVSSIFNYIIDGVDEAMQPYDPDTLAEMCVNALKKSGIIRIETMNDDDTDKVPEDTKEEIVKKDEVIEETKEEEVNENGSD